MTNSQSSTHQFDGLEKNSQPLSSRELKIVLYCKTSGRAALAACALHDMGYLNVKSIAGGMDAWIAAGKPVVKPALPTFE
jgi:rhodanese-related sulfurtransferase